MIKNFLGRPIGSFMPCWRHAYRNAQYKNARRQWLSSNQIRRTFQESKVHFCHPFLSSTKWFCTLVADNWMQNLIISWQTLYCISVLLCVCCPHWMRDWFILLPFWKSRISAKLKKETTPYWHPTSSINHRRTTVYQATWIIHPLKRSKDFHSSIFRLSKHHGNTRCLFRFWWFVFIQEITNKRWQCLVSLLAKLGRVHG